MDGQLAGGLTPGESRCSHVCKLTELHLPRKCRDGHGLELAGGLTPGESRCSHVCELTELHLPRKCRDGDGLGPDCVPSPC